MPAGPCTQFCFALSALLSPALCAAVDDPASRPPGARPFIGLLLPLNAPEFSRAAEAVRLGCQAALVFAENRQSLQVARTDAQPESILAEYEAAVQRGAAVIVGPLTRSGVTALAQAGRVSVVTLALNVADGDAPLPQRLYTFGLSAETEARAVARMAFARGLREGAVVQASNLLAKRLSRAFADEWFALGGRISDVREFGARADLVDLRRGLADSQAQFIFLAAEADQARTVRPYLNNQLQILATSQVNDGKNDPLVNSDLNGIRVVGLHEPGHVDEADAVQIRVDERIVLAVVDLGGCKDLELVVQIGSHGARLVGLRGEKDELCLRVRQTPAQIDQIRSRSELPHVADPSAEREPFVRKSPAQALGEQVRCLHDRALAQPARESVAGHRARFGLRGKTEGVEARRERHVAVCDVQSEREHADAARLSERRDPRARQRADHHGGAALHGGCIFGEDAFGLSIGARHLQGLAVLRENERGLTAQAHGLGCSRELRSIEREQETDERPFARGPACRIGRASCRERV